MKFSELRVPTIPSVAPARILLAEDDDELRSLLSLSLREDGFEVVEVGDGQALLMELQQALSPDGEQRGYDVVVSDIRMPGYTAIEVLDGFERALTDTPVILVTAFGDAATHARAVEAGATAVFDKPFDVDDLRTFVVNVLSRKFQRPHAALPRRAVG